MPTAARVKRRKLTKQSQAAGSSDDEVVYVGTVRSPQRQTQQERQNEVIEIDSSSSSSSSSSDTSRFSDDGFRQPKSRTKKEASAPSSVQKSSPNKPTEFLTSLYSLLTDSKLSHLISFHVPSKNEPQSQGGGIANRGKIIVHNPDRLQDKALGKYFAISSFGNFKKGLLRYGFRCVHHYGSEGQLRASSYVHDDLGTDVESVLELFSLKKRAGLLRSEESTKLISLTRERRLNKRDRARSYDQVEEIVVQRKDPPDVPAGKIQSNVSVRRNSWAAGAVDDADLLSNNLKRELSSLC